MSTKVPMLTRRAALALTSGTLLTSIGVAKEGESATDKAGLKPSVNGIQRYARALGRPGVPLISRAVAHGGVVYVSGATADPSQPPDKLGDVKEQTRQALAVIDELLAQAGTSKSNLLTAQIYLTDMKNFVAHNAAWNEWVDPNGLPSRACLLSPQLSSPNLLVEIMVTAARSA